VTLGGLIGDFQRLISVEISKSLHETNSKRFQGQKHVTLLQGDSRSCLQIHQFVVFLSIVQDYASANDPATSFKCSFAVSFIIACVVFQTIFF
jgi:hypothetical protein